MGLLDHREVLSGRRPTPLGGVVRDLDRHATLTPDTHGLGDRRNDRLALAAHVRGVQAVVGLDDPHELDQLLGR